MNTLVPLDWYYPLYLNLCFLLVLFTLFHTLVLDINDQKNLQYINISGYILIVLLILHIGLRPISHLFGDTTNYYKKYMEYYIGAPITTVDDFGWHVFMKFMSGIASIHTFFTICAFIYIYPMYKISKKYFGKYWYYCFIMFVVSFSFWTYSVNGIRNGAALSMFLWGISFRKNNMVMLIMFFIAINFHKTAILPIVAYTLTYFFNNPKVYFKFWFLCIPLSLIAGSIFITIFSSIGFGGDDRLSGYLTTQSEQGTFAATGFRWDFLFHSAFAVFAGWYFVIKRKFEDKQYYRLLNTYLICNSFWILIINANYSNRFAYLSWFMMALIIVYPMLKMEFFKNNHSMIGKIMLIYFGFTYFMYYGFYS